MWIQPVETGHMIKQIYNRHRLIEAPTPFHWLQTSSSSMTQSWHMPSTTLSVSADPSKPPARLLAWQPGPLIHPSQSVFLLEPFRGHSFDPRVFGGIGVRRVYSTIFWRLYLSNWFWSASCLRWKVTVWTTCRREIWSMVVCRYLFKAN